MAKSSSTRSYLSAPERRAEIVAAAARIGVEEGLERITLRRVAEAVGVRPGLINHYFPEAESLVADAFVHSTLAERGLLFAHGTEDSAATRLTALLERAFDAQNSEMSRLWLNARNLSRYNEALRHAVSAQETSNRDLLTELILAGIEAGEFRSERPDDSALLILILLDALSGYSNDELTEVTPLVAPVIRASTERELGLAPGALSPRTA